MKIHENHDSWVKTYHERWLAEFQRTGSCNWSIYERPRNRTPITGPGIDLASSRLMLITSAGGYLLGKQAPFDAGNPLGDYTIRVFSPDIPFDQLAFAHEHYDHTAVNADPQVLLPLDHLRAMATEGTIGELTAVISFMGYQPDVSQVLEETIPAILQIAQEENAKAALLVPA